MPRQRTNHSRRVYVLPDDFPQRLRRFGEESGLSWAEMARRIETYPLTIRRWRDDGVRPTQRHQLALLALAESMGLGHIFTEWHVPRRAPAPGGFPDRRRRRAARPSTGRAHVDEAAMAQG